ncbi:N-acetyltransferase [Labrys sp. LIt4]|uniref:GNAT family N-acetyltransferase n=1 Tax=Labrys okinawensis TaxID=346911 RepID=A0A2S9Q6N6_9HYPH|nr:MULTISPECIES: N-acetyltransferase [Labrys]MBP0578878.1 N-acetyltransferase [Labrys sp. LIt4]PRH85011.1 GNAT family N-acetyltransferase [Labrys okinawensis]
MQIRPERADDIDTIRAMTRAAFEGKPYSSQTEAAIVDGLRAAGALTLSLVAEEESGVVGHVAFSPVTIDGAFRHWYGLGPVSVRPDRQKNGIGRALIETGLADLRRQEAQGCVVLGDPAYYGRFGFKNEVRLCLPGVPPVYFQCLPFGADMPQGDVAYHPAFEAK